MQDSERKDRLESALMCTGRHIPDLAELLRRLLPPSELADLVKLAGRRKAGSKDDATSVAHAFLVVEAVQQGTLAAVAARLPEPAADLPTFEPGQSPWLSRDTHLQLLSQLATSADLSDWEKIPQWLSDWPDVPTAPADPKPEPRTEAPRPEPEKSGAEKEMLGLRARLAELQAEITRLQAQIGNNNREIAELEVQVSDARSEAAQEKQRATQFKQRLTDATDTSDREEELAERCAKAENDLRVLEAKFAVREEEVEDLRGVLADMDRYLAMPAEEVPSFRDRPLQPEEIALAQQLSERKENGKPVLKLLVIGGGEPQFRHRDKLTEYAEVVGFQSHWRMAEYESWHREMGALKKDMRLRFDALVILHWNRTTFTRKARGICNDVGQKPCMTCHYEGFTSLRQTLQEILRQLLAAEAA